MNLFFNNVISYLKFLNYLFTIIHVEEIGAENRDDIEDQQKLQFTCFNFYVKK